MTQTPVKKVEHGYKSGSDLVYVPGFECSVRGGAADDRRDVPHVV